MISLNICAPIEMRSEEKTSAAGDVKTRVWHVGVAIPWSVLSSQGDVGGVGRIGLNGL